MGNSSRFFKESFWPFRISPPVWGLVAFLFILLLTSLVVRQRYYLEKAEEEARLEATAVRTRLQLQSALAYSLSATKTLAYLIENYGEPANFDEVASEILYSNKYIDAIELVEGGVIKYVYPLKGNEAAVGYNILEDTRRNKEAYKAIEKRQLYFAGPFELKQGGVAVVGRLPIFKQDKFWGFSVVIIKLNTLLSAAGADSTLLKEYHLQLSKFDPDMGELKHFLPPYRPLTGSRQVSVPVPDGEWMLSLAPATADVALRRMWVAIVLCLLLSANVGVMVWFIMRTPATLQKQVNERTAELQSSEQRNRAIVNAIPGMILVMDRNGTFLDHNNPHGQQTLMRPEDFLGKSYKDVLPQPLAGATISRIKESLDGKKMLWYEYELPVNGEVKDYEARFVPLEDDRVMVMILDITAEKQAQRVIEESQRKITTMVERMSEGFVSMDKDWRVIYVNERGAGMFQRTREDLMGKILWDEFPGSRDREFYRVCMKAWETQQYTEYENYHANLDLWHLNYFYPSAEGMTMFFKDVTEARKARRAFETIAARNQLTLANMLDGYLLTDITGQVLEVNRAYCDMMGYDREEMLQLNIRQLVAGMPQEDIEKRLNEVLKEGKVKIETAGLRKDGGIIDLEISAVVNRLESEQVVAGFVRDVTQRNRYQRELVEKQDELRNLASYLQNIREEERTNISREIHDELGQILTAVKMDAAWLKSKAGVAPAAVERLENMMLLIDESVKSVRRISSQLRPGVLDDLGLTAAMEWQLREFEKRSGMKCELRASVVDSAIPPEVATGVFRVFQEALTNIARHSGATEVTCTLTTRQPSGCLQLEVHDNGTGFNPEQAKGKKSLGLTGMRERALMMGGELEIITGSGTTIQLNVPCKQPVS